ncbi:MAG: hypothetical protein NVS3B7_10550 [Candidatus Elarobacter sp.]
MVGVLYNRSTGEVLSERVRFARTAIERIVGLVPRHDDATEALWFDACQAVHTLAMRSVVDLIFLDRDLRVVRLEHAIRPGRPLIWCREADSVLEVGYGFFARCDVLVGDRLWLSDSMATFAYAVNSPTPCGAVTKETVLNRSWAERAISSSAR